MPGVAYYMTLKEPGDPRTSRLEMVWEKNKMRIKAKEKMRKRANKMTVVQCEEDLIGTNLGSI